MYEPTLTRCESVRGSPLASVMVLEDINPCGVPFSGGYINHDSIRYARGLSGFIGSIVLRRLI